MATENWSCKIIFTSFAWISRVWLIENCIDIIFKDLSSTLSARLTMSMKRVRNKEKVHSLVNTLSKKGIVLMAVDFDQTLISFHSGGIWKDSIDKLAEYVRPCMKDLMDVAIERGLHVCIVTYFMQSWVIKELLKKLFGRYFFFFKLQCKTTKVLSHFNAHAWEWGLCTSAQLWIKNRLKHHPLVAAQPKQQDL